jgi:hypothetical protein
MTMQKNTGLVFKHTHTLSLSPLTSIHLKGWGSNLVSDFPSGVIDHSPGITNYYAFTHKLYFQSYFCLILTCIPQINCKRSSQNLVINENKVVSCQSITSIQFRVMNNDTVTTVN